MKLVSTLLRGMADFLVEHGAGATIIESADTTVGARHGHDEAAKNATDADHPRASISPALRSRLHTVIDSLSDDETARVLAIGARQVRRRALTGALYFFQVGRRRRYPCWQFIGDYRVLPGLHDVTRLVPKDWPPETVDAFMSTRHPHLLLRGVPSSPVAWLAHGGDPSVVSRLLSSAARD
jgi:hypothetical protein